MARIFQEEATVDISNSNNTTIDSKDTANDTKIMHTISELATCDGFKLPHYINFYTNGLLELATPIILVLLSVPRQDKPFDLGNFRLQLLDLLRDFKSKSITFDYHPSVIEKSTYVLCVALDEAIAHTSWGEKGGWVNHSLLSSMFTQRNGGEIFFVLLDKACQQPKLLIDFIELVYILLILGFKGKYSDTDQNELYEIKSYVFTLLEHYHQEPNLSLPEVTLPTNGGKPFVGLRYKYLVYYLCLAMVVVFVGMQIKYLSTTKSLSTIAKEVTQDINKHITEQVKLLQDKQVSIELPAKKAPGNKNRTKVINDKDPNTLLRTNN